MTDKKYKQHLMIWIIVTVLVAGGMFFMGSKHGQAAAKTAFAAMRGNGSGQRGRFGAGGGAVMGSVIAKDDTSMTIKMRDGSSRIVLYSGSTQVQKSAPGTASDVTVGSQITVLGTQNTDGSVTAQNIQIRPTMPAPTGTQSGTQAQ